MELCSMLCGSLDGRGVGGEWIHVSMAESLCYSPETITTLFVNWLSVQFCCSVMSNSATPWTPACQASLSITNSRSLLKLMSIKSVMPSNHLILCHPLSSCLQSFPASESFPLSQFFESGGQSIGVSASASVLPVNIQDWFPLRSGKYHQAKVK